MWAYHTPLFSDLCSLFALFSVRLPNRTTAHGRIIDRRLPRVGCSLFGTAGSFSDLLQGFGDFVKFKAGAARVQLGGITITDIAEEI